MTNLATALTEAAQRYPQRPAVLLDGRLLNFAELDEYSARVAGGLLAHGVRPGDRVGLSLHRSCVYPVLYFGALRVGAIVMPLYFRSRPGAVRPRGAARGARLVFVSDDAERARESDTGDTTFIPVGPDFLDQLAFWPHRPGVVRRADGDPAVTLGAGEPAVKPQATTLTHAFLRANASATARTLRDEPAAEADDRPGRVPAFSSTGRTHGLNAAILAGACLPPGPEPAAPATRTARDEQAGVRPALTGSGER
ncbi:AMP-binding protein [Streptomyces sp. NPDC021093]|uniref:AMP-binding protein n=1 Tax=Streptomyces sp. NPDC021093 TaxID=3365112 RepID=UPI00378E87FC